MSTDFMNHNLCHTDMEAAIIPSDKPDEQQLNQQEELVIQDYLVSLPAPQNHMKYTSFVCRLCGADIDNASAHNMFTTDGLCESLATRINKYLPIEVSETDTLPKAVCQVCVVKLNDFHELVEKCQVVEERFRKMFVFETRYVDDESSLDLLHQGEDAELSYIESLVVDASMVTFHSERDSMQTFSCCRFCNVIVYNVQMCLEHCNLHQQPLDVNYVCVLCQYVMTTQAERDVHVQAHFVEDSSLDECLNTSSFTCKQCDEPLSHLDMVLEHCLQHSSDKFKQLSCIICCKQVTRAKLGEHIARHFPYHHVYTCETCHDVYSDAKALKHHRCTVLRKYKCPQCKQSFSTQHRLQFHVEFHRTKSTYCDTCNKDFKFESKVYSHYSSVHDGVREKPYCCDVCGKTFAWQTVLDSHKRVHDNDRPYKCSKCDARFCSKPSLRSHMPSHEDSEQLYCDKCDFHTGHKVVLQKHKAKFHRTLAESQTCVRCLLCNEVFPNKYHAEVECHYSHHVTLQPEILLSTQGDMYEELVVCKLYQCECCDRCFATVSHLTDHRATHRSLSFECRLCDAFYSKHDLLVKHRRVHINITSQYNSKLTVQQVMLCDNCLVECIDYKQLSDHKERSNCTKNNTAVSKQLVIKRRLKPLKANQLYVNATGLYECRQCQRAYKNRRRYRLHIATHT